MTQNPKTSLKKTNIPWIWEIPEDWEVKKLKFVFKYVTWWTPSSGKSDYYDFENGYNWMTIADLDWKYTGESKNKITELAVKETNMQIVPKWSLLYSFKLSVGQLAFVSEDTYTNEAILSILPKEWLNLDFWYYALQAYFISNANENIYWAKIFNQFTIDNGLVIVPSYSDQIAIANFLDQKTEKISTLISNKKKLINLLKEQKQSIIHRAVTKGIDPNARMKDSWIPWIGEIPEDWEVRRLKTVTKSVQTWSTPKDPDSNPAFLNWTIPWYWPADFNDSLILPGETFKMINQSAMDAWELNFYPENTIFIIGIGATLWKIWLSRVRSSSNQQLNAIILSEIVIPEFWLYFLNATQEIIKNLANSATLPILNQTQTKNLFFFLPSISIQKAVVEYIEQETTQIDTAIEKIEKEITLIEEYQISLIYQAVTGKISIS